MKNVDKARLVKMVVAVVLLAGVGVAVIVAMNIDTGNEVGKIGQDETGKAMPRDDSNGDRADESWTKPKGATSTEESDNNESVREVGYAGDTGFSFVGNDANVNDSINLAEKPNSDVIRNIENGQAETEAEKNAREEAERLAREEAERLAREEAERLAREEAEQLARIEQMLVAGAGVYSWVDESVNDYPWRNECPRGNKPPMLSTFGEYVIGGYQCECVSYAAWKVYQEYGVLIHWGNAYSWDDRARMTNYRVDNSPAAGAVGQIDRAPYGHVFWVESVNTDGSINITEYNNPYATYLYSGEYREQDFGARTIPAEEASQFNYIHFEDLTRV